MNLRVIEKARFRQMPWANGGGITTELYVKKDASGRILWRLSMAGVESDGPFSHFPGYDRVLVLLEGHGLTLSHGNGTIQELSTVGDMACFPGDAGTHATLPGGPVRDFNVIADRATCRPVVTVLDPGEVNRLAVPEGALAVYALDGSLQVTAPGRGTQDLPRGDLLLVEAVHPGNWEFSGAIAIVVQILSLA